KRWRPVPDGRQGPLGRSDRRSGSEGGPVHDPGPRDLAEDHEDGRADRVGHGANGAVTQDDLNAPDMRRAELAVARRGPGVAPGGVDGEADGVVVPAVRPALVVVASGSSAGGGREIDILLPDQQRVRGALADVGEAD